MLPNDAGFVAPDSGAIGVTSTTGEEVPQVKNRKKRHARPAISIRFNIISATLCICDEPGYTARTNCRRETIYSHLVLLRHTQVNVRVAHCVEGR